MTQSLGGIWHNSETPSLLSCFWDSARAGFSSRPHQLGCGHYGLSTWPATPGLLTSPKPEGFISLSSRCWECNHINPSQAEHTWDESALDSGQRGMAKTLDPSLFQHLQSMTQPSKKKAAGLSQGFFWSLWLWDAAITWVRSQLNRQSQSCRRLWKEGGSGWVPLPASLEVRCRAKVRSYNRNTEEYE